MGLVTGRGDGGDMKGVVTNRLFSHRLLLIGATYLVGSIAGIILLPILTKQLSLADYGIWVLVLAAVTLMPLVVDLGLPGAMVRYLAVERERAVVQEGFYSVLLIVMGSACAVTLPLALLAPFIATGSLDGHTDVIRIMAAVIFVDCLNAVLFNYLRTFQRIKLYSGFINLQTLLLLAFLIVTLGAGMGLLGAVASLLASRAVVMLSMLGLVVRELGLRRPSFSRVKEFLGFGVPMIPGNLSDWALSSSDRYVLGIMLGVVYVGYYNPGYALSAMIVMLVNPLRFLLPAMLSELFDQGRMERVRAVLRHSVKYFLLIAIPSAVGLGILSRDLLRILTTPEIASEGYLVTPVVAVAMVLYGTQIILGQVLIIEKQTKKLGTVMAVTAGLNVLLNLWLVPWVGILGAAVSTLAAFAFALLATARLSSKYLHVGVDTVTVAKAILAAAVMGASIWMLRVHVLPGGLAGTATAILVGVAVYTALVLALRALSREEWKFFLDLLRSARGDGGRRSV